MIVELIIYVIPLLIVIRILHRKQKEQRRKNFVEEVKKGDPCMFQRIYSTQGPEKGIVESYNSTYLYSLVQDSDGFVLKVFTNSIQPPKNTIKQCILRQNQKTESVQNT